MITEEFAEKLFDRMNKHCTDGTSLSTEELETLTKLMCSDVMLKAFGQAIAFCRGTEREMALLRMEVPESIFEFTRGQGQIVGVNRIISGLLGLVTEKPIEEPPSE